MNLGDKLKLIRQASGLTLRQIEESTGISNAYLSQIENNKIKKPSARILYKLASIYGINIEELLAASGLINQERAPLSPIELGPISNLTIEEMDKLLEYLAFLRYRKARRNQETINQ